MIETSWNIIDEFRAIFQNSLILLTSMLIFQRTSQFPSNMSFSLCTGIMIKPTHTQELDGEKQLLSILSWIFMVDSQEPNGSFLNFFLIIFFSNICIRTFILRKIYRSSQIYNCFVLSRVNISGAINNFVTLGIKKNKIMENVKIFLSFPSGSLNPPSPPPPPNCCVFLGLEPCSVLYRKYKQATNTILI